MVLEVRLGLDIHCTLVPDKFQASKKLRSEIQGGYSGLGQYGPFDDFFDFQHGFCDLGVVLEARLGLDIHCTMVPDKFQASRKLRSEIQSGYSGLSQYGPFDDF